MTQDKEYWDKWLGRRVINVNALLLGWEYPALQGKESPWAEKVPGKPLYRLCGELVDTENTEQYDAD